jgi:flagellar motor switch protein FliN/FliY
MTEEATVAAKDTQGQPAAQEGGGAGAAAAAQGAGKDAAARFAEGLPALFAKAAEDWSSAGGKKVTAAVGAITTPGKEGLSGALAAGSPAVRAVIKAGGTSAAMAVVAGEDAALAIAREALGDKTGATLDDAAMAAFGEAAKRIIASIEGGWIAGGATGLTVEAGQPERLGGGIEGCDEGATICDVTFTPEGGAGAAVKFVFSGPAAGVTGKAVEGQAEPAEGAPNIDRILQISVPVVVEIARRQITVKEVLGFKPGTVLEFDKKSDDMLNLMAGQAQIGTGEAVKVGESFGLRVLEVGTVRERIKILAT